MVDGWPWSASAARAPHSGEDMLVPPIFAQLPPEKHEQ